MRKRERGGRHNGRKERETRGREGGGGGGRGEIGRRSREGERGGCDRKMPGRSQAKANQDKPRKPSDFNRLSSLSPRTPLPLPVSLSPSPFSYVS